jgi:cellulose synthase/poly-beta-1,6-N-acetylglucosamine synthase-like glycosyltransferase
MEQQLKATVAICTYNGRARIGEVIRALAAQSLPVAEWELVVVDNASMDDTNEVASGLLGDLFPGNGRVVLERRAGLSFARARAAAEARGELLLFLDDDTVPAADWVEMAVRSFRDNARAGVIGGRVLPRWEVQPTALAEAVASYALAICDRGDERIRISDAVGGVVGAGMCVRTAVLRDVYGDPAGPAQVTGRRGSNLISGEDLAICMLVRQQGWECWYEPAMVIEHVLPETRMRKEYLLRLYEGIGRGEAATRKLYDWKARTALSWAIGMKDLVRWGVGRVRGVPTGAAGTAGDVRDLELQRTLGRALQGLRWPRN